MTTPHTLGAKDIAREVAVGVPAHCRRRLRAPAVPPHELGHRACTPTSPRRCPPSANTCSARTRSRRWPTISSPRCSSATSEQIAPKLGDSEPWATIGAALTDVVTAWRTAHPTYRTAHEFHQRRLRWEEEASAKAATTTIDGEGR